MKIKRKTSLVLLVLTGLLIIGTAVISYVYYQYEKEKQERRTSYSLAIDSLNDSIRNKNMNDQEREDRILMLKKLQKESPDSFRAEFAQSIEDGIITVGMTPFEANLAGGAFVYQVSPDKKWPEGTNPLKIMWAQTNQPDDSEIIMTFTNNTQFNTTDNISFKVFIEQGRVSNIEKK